MIRSRNKHEDRLLNVRLEFYEREKNIQLNIIKREQHKLERVRRSLVEEADKNRVEKRTLPLPSWMAYRSKLRDQAPKSTFSAGDSEWNSDSTEFNVVLSSSTTKMFTARDIIRRHSIQ